MVSFSTDRLKQTGLWIAALALGLACGRLLHSLLASPGDGSGLAQVQVDRMSGGERSRRSSPMSETSRYLWREGAGLRDLEAYDEAVNRLYRDSPSPLRARSLQSHRVQNSSFEEWEYLLCEGKVTRLECLDEVGEYLARLDQDRALEFLFYGRKRFANLEQFYAFRDSCLGAITRDNPNKVLELFRKIGTGEHMDNARYFTLRWAESDPRATAELFEELMIYRNMGLEGATAVVPYDEYAEVVMKSWLERDPEEAETYLAGLPEGRKREALQRAFISQRAAR